MNRNCLQFIPYAAYCVVCVVVLDIIQQRSTPLPFSTIVAITVFVPSRAFSRILESIHESNMILGEDLAEIVITDIVSTS